MTWSNLFYALGVFVFAGGVAVMLLFCASCLLEDESPSFVFVFTKMKRLTRKRDRLAEQLKFLEGSHSIYNEIAALQEELGKKAINNPRGFLNE